MGERAVSAFGMLVMMALAFALCPRDRRRLVKLRTVGGGLLMLIAFAVIVLRTPASRVFLLGNDLVDRLLAFTKARRSSDAFVPQLQQFIVRKDIPGALTLARAEKNSPVAKVVTAALTEYEEGLEAMKELGPEELGDFVKDQLVKSAKMIKDAGIEPE